MSTPVISNQVLSLTKLLSACLTISEHAFEDFETFVISAG
jgi:hypothetical protein